MRSLRFLSYGANILSSFAVDLYFLLFSFRWRLLGPKYYFQSRRYPNFIKTGDAKAFIEDYAMQFCRGRGLDVGAGKHPLRGARAIDDARENAYDIQEESGTIDFVFSSHTLEHVPEIDKALNEFARVLRVGGVLFLYLPHPASEMWLPDNFRHHLHRLPPGEMQERVKAAGFKIVEGTFTPDVYFSYFIRAERL